jgi:hypothetical protein
MEDLAECFEVAAIDDVILSLNQTLEERRQGLCRVYGEKARDRESQWTVRLDVDFSKSLIKDLVQ